MKEENKSTKVKSKAKPKKSSYEEEKVKCRQKILSFKLPCEANVVAILYKQPDIFYSTNLKLEDFSHNEWRVFFSIGKMIVTKEVKPILDDVTIGIYLEKHLKLKEKYDEFGGWETIDKAKDYIDVANFEGYTKDLNKWNTILKLLDNGFPIVDRLSDFADYNIDEIYEEYEALLNHTFINAESDMKTYDISYRINELIAKLDEGFAVGLPFYKMSLLTKQTGGSLLGNITLLGSLSNVGKSSFLRNVIFPSIIENNEKIVVMVNEESYEKTQREFLVWVANNIFKEDLQKYRVRDGKYSEELKVLLHRCADWITEQASNNTITIVPLENYNANKAIKIIRKYSALQVKYFAIDTMKSDSDISNKEQSWQNMMDNMVKIYDTVKESAKNVFLIGTFQLTKSAAKIRYLTQNDVGVAKNMIDPASTVLMMRTLNEDEKEGGKNEVHCYRVEGKKGLTKIPAILDKDKNYIVLFVVKSREGATSEHQIIVESDLSRNIFKEIGICNIPQDW